MPRKKYAHRSASLLVDKKYRSGIVHKLIAQIMWDGKKNVASAIVYGAMDFLAEKTSLDPLQATEQAMANIKPPIEVRSRRVGGATYQVPCEVRIERQNSLAVRWLVTIARARKEHTMAEKLGKEMLDAFNNTGTVIKKKQDTIKMAEANRAFAHYRW